MTEIPEHLLKRSKERRRPWAWAAASAGDAAPAADAPSGAAGELGRRRKAGGGAGRPSRRAACPPPRRPRRPIRPMSPPPKAARRCRCGPPRCSPSCRCGASSTTRACRSPPAGANDPLALGAEIYTGKGGCAGCHGTDGSGGVGAKLSGGEVLKTFKNPLAMVHWVAFGADGGARRQRHLRRSRPSGWTAQHRHAARRHAGAEGQAHAGGDRGGHDVRAAEALRRQTRQGLRRGRLPDAG